MKLLLGDDHPIFSAVLGELFEGAGHTVLESGLSVAAALAKCEPTGAEACLVGLDSTPLSVLDARSAPGAPAHAAVVVVMSAKHRSLVGRAVELPVAGVAMREDDFFDLLRVVTDSTSGTERRGPRKCLSPCASAALRHFSERPVPPHLTRREQQILRRLAAGESPSKVAGYMDVRVTTVRTHIASVFHKLGAHTMVEAVAIARRTGLLDECGGEGSGEVSTGRLDCARVPECRVRAPRVIRLP